MGLIWDGWSFESIVGFKTMGCFCWRKDWEIWSIKVLVEEEQKGFFRIFEDNIRWGVPSIWF